VGYKYNMMDLQAAIGMHQIGRVEQYWRRRRRVWDSYNEAFVDLPLALPKAPEPGTRHALHLYTVLLDKTKAPITRDLFISALHRRNIGTGVHYRAIPVHPVYQRLFGWRAEDFPVAAAIGESTVSLPLSPKLTEVDVADVIEAVRDLLTKPRNV
jgi:dTDP-4-amino-4,6-dideoxygalactose transaminase